MTRGGPLIYQKLGIATVATVSWTVDQVARRLLPGEVAASWTDPTGEISLVEYPLPDSLCGRGLVELADADRYRPLMVTRAGQARLAGSHMVGQEGDVVHFAVRTDALADLNALLEAGESEGARIGRPASMRVSIAGGGVVGQFIARDLVANGHSVLIVESDPAVFARQEPLPNCTWFAGDACEVSTLHRAGFGDADVVVAATGDDEDNLVVSLLSKQEFAVPRVIARVNHPKNRWLFNESWGVDVSVSVPAPADRAGRGGGVGRHPGAAAPFRRGQGRAGRGHPGRGEPGRRPVASPTWACPATPAWSPWCGTGGWWYPGATPPFRPGTR